MRWGRRSAGRTTPGGAGGGSGQPLGLGTGDKAPEGTALGSRWAPETLPPAGGPAAGADAAQAARRQALVLAFTCSDRQNLDYVLSALHAAVL